MADLIHSLFRYKKVNAQKLKDCGFVLESGVYSVQKTLANSGFVMTVKVFSDGNVSAEVTEPQSGEPYTLHLAESAVGSFVGGVREEYEQILSGIAEKCFEPDVFKSDDAKGLIAYVRNTYGDELEYLWGNFPGNAIWRRKDNKKWYCVMMTLPKRKLGIWSDEIAEIIDLRANPSELEKFVDGKRFFRGWHMNKKNWYTIVLDGSVPIDEICRLTDISYTLAKK